MRRIKTYKKWSIWRLTAAEAIDVGGRFAAFLPADVPEGRGGKGQHPGLPILAEAGAGERRRRW